MRGVCLWLHDFRCFICKKPCNNLECHHINKVSYDNRMHNLMPLCPNCHKLVGMMKKLNLHSKEYILSLLENKLKQYKNMIF